MIDRAPHVWRPEKPSPKERWLTEAEIHRLLHCAGSPHIELAIHLMFATAARVGAILDLTWDRVDFGRRQINLRLPDAQTRKGRAIVPMNNSIRAALQTAHGAALSDYVVEYAGKPVASIRNGFTAAVRRAGLKEVTQHTLRHTSAVHMAAAGIPMDQISQFLGHSNTQITAKVYVRFAPDHLRKAADVLDFSRIRSASGTGT